MEGGNGRRSALSVAERGRRGRGPRPSTLTLEWTNGSGVIRVRGRPGRGTPCGTPSRPKPTRGSGRLTSAPRATNRCRGPSTPAKCRRCGRSTLGSRRRCGPRCSASGLVRAALQPRRTVPGSPHGPAIRRRGVDVAVPKARRRSSVVRRCHADASSGSSGARPRSVPAWRWRARRWARTRPGRPPSPPARPTVTPSRSGNPRVTQQLHEPDLAHLDDRRAGYHHEWQRLQGRDHRRGWGRDQRGV